MLAERALRNTEIVRPGVLNSVGTAPECRQCRGPVSGTNRGGGQAGRVCSPSAARHPMLRRTGFHRLEEVLVVDL